MLGLASYADEAARQRSRRPEEHEMAPPTGPSSILPVGKQPRGRTGRGAGAWLLAMMTVVVLLVAGAALVMVSLAQRHSTMIRTARPLPSTAAESQAQVHDNLVNWVRGTPGAVVGPMRFGFFEHGGKEIRGMATTRAVEKGEVVLKVPRAIIMMPSDVRLERFNWGPKGRPAPPMDALLAVRLLEERHAVSLGEVSQFDSWLKTVPREEEYRAFHPLMADEMTLHMYKELPLAKDIRKKQGQMRAVWNDFGIKDFFTFPEFWEAFVQTISRAYGIPEVDPASGKLTFQAAVVPLSDMGNTDVEERINTKWGYNTEMAAFYLNTTKDVREGEEFIQSYQVSSKKDNTFMQYMFGMMIENNPKGVQPLSKEQCKSFLSLPKATNHGVRETFERLTEEHCKDFNMNTTRILST